MNQNLLGEQRTWYSNFGSSAECEPLVATYLDYSAAHARFDLPHASETQQRHISITQARCILIVTRIIIMHNDKYSYGSSFIAFPFAKHAIQNVSPNSTIRSRHCDTIMQAPCNNCIRKKKNCFSLN